MPSIANRQTGFWIACLLVAFLALAFSSCSHDLGNGHSYSKLYPIQQGSDWGWIDSVGNVVVAPEHKYYDASFFLDGLGYLKIDDHHHVAFFNSRLEVVWESDDVKWADVYHGGYASAFIESDNSSECKRVFIDREGKVLFELPGYSWSSFEMEDGLFIRLMDDPKLYGLDGTPMGAEGYEQWFCDQTHELDDPLWFPRYFREGLMLVQDHNNHHEGGPTWHTFMDKKGAVKPYRFPRCGCFNNGLAFAQDSTTALYGYIDHDGHWVIPPQYKDAGNFSEGLAPVQQDSAGYGRGWGYIDATGKVVIGFQFQDASEFSQGLALARKEGFGSGSFINQHGKPVIPVPES
ncbi:MAG: hypothetical protein RLZZ519_1193 [Bacteroidota bacterium]|jgi:hypothetical protein